MIVVLLRILAVFFILRTIWGHLRWPQTRNYLSLHFYGSIPYNIKISLAMRMRGVFAMVLHPFHALSGSDREMRTRFIGNSLQPLRHFAYIDVLCTLSSLILRIFIYLLWNSEAIPWITSKRSLEFSPTFGHEEGIEHADTLGEHGDLKTVAILRENFSCRATIDRDRSWNRFIGNWSRNTRSSQS